MNPLFFFILIAFTTTKVFAQSEIASSEPKSYNEFVFPPDIHKYPLLFSTFWTNNDGQIRDSHKKQANNQINQFIEDEKQSRGVEHLIINDAEGKEYSNSIYRYIVLTRPFGSATATPTGPDPYGPASAQGGGVKYEYYLTLCLYIKDRKTSKVYALHGRPSGTPTATYAESDISPAVPSAFFSDLKRIIKNLDTIGVDETFGDELKRQQKPKKAKIAGEVIMYSILAGGLAWYIYDIIQ